MLNRLVCRTFCQKSITAVYRTLLVTVAFSTVASAALFDAFTDKSIKYQILQQGNFIWMATNGGVIRWNMLTNQAAEFTTAQGLSDNFCSRAIADASNNVWITTRKGLCRFDGQNWFSYDVPGGSSNFYSNSQGLISSDDGKILYTFADFDKTRFACFNGAVQLPDTAVSGALVWTDGTNRRWEWLRRSATRAFGAAPIFEVASATDTIADSLPSGYVYMGERTFADCNGRVWIPVTKLTSSKNIPFGYSMFDGTCFHHFFTVTSSLIFAEVVIDEPAEPLDTAAGRFTYRFFRNDGTIDTINCTEWDSFLKAKDSICIPPSMTIDTSGRLWIGTKSGLVRCDAQGAAVFNFQTGPCPPVGNLLTEDNLGNIWVSGVLSSLSAFYNKVWVYPQELNAQLASINVRKTVAPAAPEKGMWFVSAKTVETSTKLAGNGVVFYNGSSTVTHYKKGNGLPSGVVYDLVVDSQNIAWCACGDYLDTQYLCSYKNKTWNSTTIPADLEGEIRQLFADKKGGVWVLANNAARYNGSSWQVFSEKLFEGYSGCDAVLEDRGGTIWFATYSQGLKRYDGSQWTTVNVSGDSNDPLISALGEDSSGKLWVALYGLGNENVEKCLWRQSEPGSLSFSPISGANAPKQATTIACDASGGMWFGSYMNGTCCRFDGHEWRIFNQKDGLSDARITSILPAKNGDVWFSTFNGVSRLQAGALPVINQPLLPVKITTDNKIAKIVVTTANQKALSQTSVLYNILGRKAPLRQSAGKIAPAQGMYIAVVPKGKRIVTP